MLDSVLGGFGRRLLWIVPTLAVFVLALFGMVASAGLNFESIFSRFRIYHVLILVLLSFGNYALRVYRWDRLLSMSGADALPRDVVLSYLIGFVMAVTPGKVGELVRVAYLKRTSNAASSSSLSALIGDRSFDLFATLTLSFLAASLVFQHKAGLILAFAITLLCILLWRYPDLFSLFLKRVYYVVPVKARLFAKMRRYLKSMRPIASYRALFSLYIVSVVGWYMEGAGFYLVLRVLGAPVDLNVAVSIFCISALLGAVSMLPGGVGGFEIVMIALLRYVEVDFGVAVVATAVIRFATLWLAVIVGFTSIPFAVRRLSSAKWNML